MPSLIWLTERHVIALARCMFTPLADHRTTLSGYIFATKARIDNRKKLLNSNFSPTCLYNMVNFGLLAAETVSLGSCPLTEFRHEQNSLYVQVMRCPILAALLHGTPAEGVSQTLRSGTRNGITELSQRSGRHLYSAGRPSRWASAHILVGCISLKLAE